MLNKKMFSTNIQGIEELNFLLTAIVAYVHQPKKPRWMNVNHRFLKEEAC
jgi:hypothetical protein